MKQYEQRRIDLIKYARVNENSYNKSDIKSITAVFITVPSKKPFTFS